MQKQTARSTLELERRQDAAFSCQRRDTTRNDAQEWQQPHASIFPDLDFQHDFGHIGASNSYLDETSGILLGHQEESTGLDITSDACFGAGLGNTPNEQCSSRAHSASLEETSISGHTSAQLYQSSNATSPGTLDPSRHDGANSNGRKSPFTGAVTMLTGDGFPFPQERSMLPAPGPPGPPKFERCSCLQQLAQLVYRLDDLRQCNERSVTIECVLQGVQMAHNPWQNLMRCSYCGNPAEQREEILLFAMSIRTLLSLLRQSTLSSVGVMVGSYELCGTFKAKVMHELSQEALQSITAALQHLQAQVKRQRSLEPMEISLRHTTWDTVNEKRFDEAEIQLRSHPLPFSKGSDSITPLLDTLQGIMKAMRHDEQRLQFHR